jgi:hypothetical protein
MCVEGERERERLIGLVDSGFICMVKDSNVHVQGRANFRNLIG